MSDRKRFDSGFRAARAATGCGAAVGPLAAMSALHWTQGAPPIERRPLRPSARCRWRRRAAFLVAAAAARGCLGSGDLGADRAEVAFSAAPVSIRGRGCKRKEEGAAKWCGAHLVGGPVSQRQPQVSRRLFDTGSFFGVGVSEAVVVGLLGWFLLGPEELYRLAKQFGNWLGELRGFVGQAAKQYESALDDENTRKAIAGIRETQRTVAEVSASWRTVADSLRDPLNIGKNLESTFSKYDDYVDKKESDSKDKAKDDKKPKEIEDKKTSTYPDLSVDEEPEPVIASPYATSSSSVGLDESPEELERKRAASREAVKDMWYNGEASASSSSGESPKDAKAYLAKLDSRLQELDSMQTQLEKLRAGIVEDSEGLRKLLQAQEDEQTAKEDKNVVAAANFNAEPVKEEVVAKAR